MSEKVNMNEGRRRTKNRNCRRLNCLALTYTQVANHTSVIKRLHWLIYFHDFLSVKQKGVYNTHVTKQDYTKTNKKDQFHKSLLSMKGNKRGHNIQTTDL